MSFESHRTVRNVLRGIFRPFATVLALGLLGPASVAVAGNQAELVEFQGGGSSLGEMALHADFGVEVEMDPGTWLEAISGLNATWLRRAGKPDLVSGQSLIPVTGGLGGYAVGWALSGGRKSGAEFLGTGLFAIPMILSNLEYQWGWKALRGTASHQFDLFLPGWSPREKLAVGIQVGNRVRARLEGFRSLASIPELDGWGAQGRLIVPIEVHWL
jgi:hypothetical protein